MRALAKCLIILALLAAPVVAPAVAMAQTQGEPPGRVGRVSVVAGTLAFYGPGDAEWSEAKINLPAATGAWFATDPKSRAQIRVGADSISLAHDTQINFVDLGDTVLRLAVVQGRIDLHLRPATWRKEDSVAIDLPRGELSVLEPGIYVVDSGGPDQPTRIMVFEGSARFVGGGVDTVVKRGEALVLTGTDALASAVEPATPDEFFEWCRAHDYRGERIAQARHVSPAMTGFEELAEYGDWTSSPEYGAVWYPKAVAADWAPYRQGRWVWIEPWGWNWVDDAPWGFAPSHYGRWARIDNRWGWVPGQIVPRPVYAPALVAYVPGPRVAVAAASAGPPIGWFPLAPGELYWPSYTRNPAYIRNVNITSVSVTRITDVTNVIVRRPANAGPPPAALMQRFANRDAAVIVPAAVLRGSRPVAPAALAADVRELRQARVALMPPPALAPARAPGAPPAIERRRDRAEAANARFREHRDAMQRPDRPNFAGLDSAPRARAFADTLRQRERDGGPPAARNQAGPGGGPGGGPPDFSRLRPDRGPGGRDNGRDDGRDGGRDADRVRPGQPPAAALPPQDPRAAPSGRPGPDGRPDFSNLAPPRAPDRREDRREELARQRAAEAAERQQARERAESEARQKVQDAAAAREQRREQPDTAGRHEDQRNEAAEAARQRAETARQQAEQKRAAEAAAREQAVSARQAQERAASEAAAHRKAEAAQKAQQAAQQRAAEAAARQQAEQHQRAAQQQAAQQRAAQAAAQQQAEQQQRAAQAAARQQAEQQRAAQQQAAQQRAAQAAAQQQAAQQQRAAQAAARQQAEQQQRAAQQQAAQQRAAAQAAQQQAAQQRAAAQQQAAQQAAQQRAAQAAAQQQAAQQQAQRKAAEAAARKAAQDRQAQACEDGKGPGCRR